MEKTATLNLRINQEVKHLNTDLMSADEIRSFLDKGIDDIDNSKSIPAKEFFANFRRMHIND